MNFDDLPPEIAFLFMTVGNAAVAAHRKAIPKKHFVEFCSEIWETMILNGPEKFGKILTGKMLKDLDRMDCPIRTDFTSSEEP